MYGSNRRTDRQSLATLFSVFCDRTVMNHETGSGYTYRGDCLVATAISRRAAADNFIQAPPNVNVASMNSTRATTTTAPLDAFSHYAATSQQQFAQNPSFAASSYSQSHYYSNAAPTTNSLAAFPANCYDPRARTVTPTTSSSYNATQFSRSQWSFPGVPIGLNQSDLVRKGLLPQPSAIELLRPDGKAATARFELTSEERKRRQIRREKNKVAAAKCRIKRRQHSKQLKEDYEGLEKSTTEIQATIAGLLEEVDKLREVLTEHACVLDEDEKAELEEKFKAIVNEPSLTTSGNQNDLITLIDSKDDNHSDDVCVFSISEIVGNNEL